MYDSLIHNPYVNMQCCVVNLPGYGLTKLYSFFNGHVYGVVLEGNLQVDIDVLDGMITEVDNERKILIFQPDEYHRIEDISRRLDCGGCVDDMTHTVTVKLLSTLVSHRVGGDEILKGLKASVEAYCPDNPTVLRDWKIRENYIGGWFISKGQDNLGVARLLSQVYDHVTGVEG